MKLKQIRRIKGYTQKEVSDLLNIPLRTLKRYENDNSVKGSFKYDQICEELWKIPVKTGQNSKISRNIVVIGAGYVGLSLAALLSINNNVVIVDIDENKIENINNRKCYLRDDLLEKMFKDNKFLLKAMKVNECDFSKTQIVLIATNTDFNTETGQFDMSSVMSSIENVRNVNKDCLIVIKSTVPVGYTERIRNKYNYKTILFSPEFLRETNALYDNLYPSRIIVGTDLKDEKLLDVLNNNYTIRTSMSTYGAVIYDIDDIKTDFNTTYIAIYVDDKYSNVGISYINIYDGMRITFKEMVVH